MEGKKHVTTACLHCRRRKIKCDGKSPCSNCHSPNRICVYNGDEDKRKTSVRKATNELRARLVQLERVLKAHNIEVPSTSGAVPNPSADGSLLDWRSDLAQEAPMPMDTAQPPATLEGQNRLGIDPNPGLIQGGIDFLGDASELPGIPPEAEDLGRYSTAMDDIYNDDTPHTYATKPDDQALSSPPDELLDSLTARMGSLQVAEDGQLRYYGPTSNLHICGNASQLWRPTIRHVATDGAEVLRRAGLDQPVRPEVETHLAKLYFAWEDPAIHAVDEHIFFSEKQRWLAGSRATKYYSESLNSAICAIGACLAPGEQLGVPEPAPEHFASRARALLDIEMDSPTVATVQALVVMSAVEASLKRDTRGWLYSGMAVQLSADLGLHICVDEQCRDGILNQQDVHVRRTTFWGVYIQDNMWSLYLGRPGSSSTRDISVTQPRAELDAANNHVWKPYPLPNIPSPVSADGIFHPLVTCTDANVNLCHFMRRINKTLKGLWAWKENLATDLQIGPPCGGTVYVPAVLQLHMQFYAVLIVLFRPYLTPNLLRGSHNAIHDARAECIRAAHSAADALRCYQKQHSFRHANVQMMHVVFTVSLIHIYSACTGGVDESQMARDDLEVCCQALLDMCQCYRSATRALEVVILLKTEWHRLAARWPDTAGSGPRKRNRPVTDAAPEERGLSNVRSMADEASGPWQVLDWTDVPQDPLFGLSPSDHAEGQSLERMLAWGENLLRAYDVEAATL